MRPLVAPVLALGLGVAGAGPMDCGPIVPAVLAGNAVIVKHSPRSPLCGEHFARAFERAGAPAHLVQALHCDHPTAERLAHAAPRTLR